MCVRNVPVFTSPLRLMNLNLSSHLCSHVCSSDSYQLGRCHVELAHSCYWCRSLQLSVCSLPAQPAKINTVQHQHVQHARLTFSEYCQCLVCDHTAERHDPPLAQLHDEQDAAVPAATCPGGIACPARVGRAKRTNLHLRARAPSVWQGASCCVLLLQCWSHCLMQQVKPVLVLSTNKTQQSTSVPSVVLIAMQHLLQLTACRLDYKRCCNHHLLSS